MAALPLNPALVFGLVPLFAGAVMLDPSSMGQQVTRLVSQDQVVFRVPVAPRTPVRGIRWLEQQGPRCVPMRAITRATLSGNRNVDFVLKNHNRVRATVDEDCPALDFYTGLYLKPDDNMLCAGRDTIHSRMGGSCRIRGFRLLRPVIVE